MKWFRWLFQKIICWIRKVLGLKRCPLIAGYAKKEIFIRRIDMATCTYRLPIQPSPSNFVESIEWWANINGAGNTALATGQPSNTPYIDYDFPVDASVEWFVTWIGDNGTEASCPSRSFVAANLEQILPGTADAEVFVRFNP